MRENDAIEKFISAFRHEFDDADAPPHVWPEVKQVLDQKQRSGLWKWRIMKIAASVAILIMAGSIGGIFLSQYIQGSKEYSNNGMLSEFHETEVFYKSQVQLALTEIQQYSTDESFQKDLEYLDAIHADLLYELQQSNTQNRQLIINALIENYRTKLAIIMKVLDSVKEKPDQKYSEDEKISI